MDISAVIITFNEEAHIAACIQSLLPVVAEVVVVDSFSTDATVSICRRLGARVISRPFDNFGAQKQFAVQQAAFDYVLSLDADECLSPQLQQSILAFKSSAHPASACSFNRLNHYGSHPIRHCGWYPDAKVRLFSRSVGHWSPLWVHELVVLPAGVSPLHLNGNLLHYTYTGPAQHLAKVRHYAALSHAQGRSASLPVVYLKCAFHFLQIYLFRLGFLDGRYGFIIACVSAKYVFWKYRGVPTDK